MSESIDDLVPLASAALELGRSAEAIKRDVQRGRLAGRQVCGRWMVERDAIARAKAGRPSLRDAYAEAVA